MIDTHAHIVSEYYDDIDLLVKELIEKNIIGVINNATNYKEALEIIELSKKYNNFLYAAIGIHPENVEEDINKIENLIKENKIVAIGEIGLDYHWRKDNKEEQKEVFIKQLKLSKKYNLPVIIHTRDSIQDCLDIIKKQNVRGIMHCFSGSYEMAKEFIKYGFKLGIGGVLTFKNSKLYEVIEKVDLEDIVLETDSPYLSPEPFRGTKNIPSNVLYVAKKIAEIKNISVEKVIEKTTENARNIFDF